ncbi:MAG: SpoIIE family protein phosphatase [Phycisphaeraceae bacterium]|nr:SpoIIE family protein phosphatase [Phycisphaeraceae bacterium]
MTDPGTAPIDPPGAPTDVQSEADARVAEMLEARLEMGAQARSAQAESAGHGHLLHHHPHRAEVGADRGGERAGTHVSDRLIGGGPASLRDFITDGSVSALCDELTRLSGVPVWLRDQSGEAIIPEWSDPDSPGGVGHPWSVVSEPEARARAFGLAGIQDTGTADLLPVPLRIRAGLLGAIVAAFPKSTGIVPPRLVTLKRALALLSSSVADVCEAQSQLAKRVQELDALFRLSSLLSGAAEPDELLQVALDLAIEVLRVDAGSIVILGEESEGEGALTVRASRGLTDAWLSLPAPLSHGGKLREMALRGDVVSIENLVTDERIADHGRVKREGLASLLSTGLLDQGRPIGLIRLYTRSPRVFTTAEGELLRAIADHSASALTTARLRKLRSQDERLNHQVRVAASVQRRMLPRSVPSVAPFDVAAHYAPTLELGGDFYDFMELGGHLGLLIGDVAGKGVPAALLMASVRASLRAYAQEMYHIDQVLERVNAALVRDTLDHEFATVWYGVADPHSLRLTYCSAGHDWPLHIRPPAQGPVTDADVRRLTADGMALGIDPAQKYPKGTVQLRAGDVVVAYTDGLHDALNPDGKRFGGTRLRRSVVELLKQEPSAGPSRIIDHVLAAVRQHAGLAGRNDDITVIALRVTDAPVPPQPLSAAGASAI